MQAISGVRGTIKKNGTKVGQCLKWSLKLSSNNPKFATDEVPGHKVSVAGVKSGTFSFNLVLNIDSAQYSSLKVGELYTIDAYENDDRFWRLVVRIESIGEEVDVNEGGEVTLPYESSLYGKWTYPDGTESTVT